jgi:hypothetical protein
MPSCVVTVERDEHTADGRPASAIAMGVTARPRAAMYCMVMAVPPGGQPDKRVDLARRVAKS